MTQRIEMLDFARGLALVAMTVFHFVFDLQMFGVLEPGTIEQPHWKYFARGIATSFLFLVGFSLYLGHHEAIRWKSWRWRMAKIVAAAVLITIATWFATPDQYIFFGILHQIAFASVACLMFLKLPAWVTIAFAGIVFFWGREAAFPVFDNPIWWWTGLSVATPNSSDYVPVFPWWSASLLGLAVAKICAGTGFIATMAKPGFSIFPATVLRFMGRNSLAYYLLHQPVMIGLLLAWLWATGKVSL